MSRLERLACLDSMEMEMGIKWGSNGNLHSLVSSVRKPSPHSGFSYATSSNRILIPIRSCCTFPLNGSARLRFPRSELRDLHYELRDPRYELRDLELCSLGGPTEWLRDPPPWLSSMRMQHGEASRSELEKYQDRNL